MAGGLTRTSRPTPLPFLPGAHGPMLPAAGLCPWSRPGSAATASKTSASTTTFRIGRGRRGNHARQAMVLMEAGNRVPADGRICVAATLEIEEAALTGESLPVPREPARSPGTTCRWVWRRPAVEGP